MKRCSLFNKSCMNNNENQNNLKHKVKHKIMIRVDMNFNQTLNSTWLAGMRLSVWSRRLAVAWSARRSWTRLRPRSLARSCWSSRLTVRPWRAPDRPRQRHSLELRLPGLRERLLWTRPGSRLKQPRLNRWVFNQYAMLCCIVRCIFFCIILARLVLWKWYIIV